jgi:hypothetical protein
MAVAVDADGQARCIGCGGAVDASALPAPVKTYDVDGVSPLDWDDVADVR